MAEQGRIVQLDSNRLRDRMLELGLKQWVVARQAGVARRTVIRWINGEVNRITVQNLQSLARVVELNPAELSSELSVDQAPSSAEQQHAARLILSVETTEMFNRSESYEAYEHLLNATRHPGMTMKMLADIYLHMMVAAAKQYNFPRAQEHGQQCIACAQRCGDAEVEFTARLNMAIIQSEFGRIGIMREQMETLLAMMESQGKLRSLPSLQNSLSRVCIYEGELALATRLIIPSVLRQSMRADREGYLDAIVQISSLCMELGAPKLAGSFLSRGHSVIENARIPIWTPYIEVREEYARAAAGALVNQARLERALASFDQIRYKEEDLYLIATRIQMFAGNEQAAIQLLNRGLEQATLRPHEKAMLLFELARIRLLTGNLEHFEKAARDAARLFGECGMPRCVSRTQTMLETRKPPRVQRNAGLVKMLAEAEAELRR